jgi:hypothetical protein
MRFNIYVEKGRIILYPIIKKIVRMNLEKFYNTTLYRLVNTQRSKSELFKLALNNTEWNIIDLEFMENEITEIENDFSNKFDEILDDNKMYEEKMVKKCVKIDVVDFYKAIFKMYERSNLTEHRNLHILLSWSVYRIWKAIKSNVNKEKLLL